MDVHSCEIWRVISCPEKKTAAAPEEEGARHREPDDREGAPRLHMRLDE